MPVMPSRFADINKIIEMLPLRVKRHMYLVGKLSGILSNKLCSSGIILAGEDELQYFGEAAFYHDIGKAFIPLELMKKPSMFTKEEMEIMKKHTVCAEVIFRDLERGRLTGLSEHLIRCAGCGSISP